MHVCLVPGARESRFQTTRENKIDGETDRMERERERKMRLQTTPFENYSKILVLFNNFSAEAGEESKVGASDERERERERERGFLQRQARRAKRERAPGFHSTP